MLDIKFLGTSHNGLYSFYKDGNYVYQEKCGKVVGWLCSYVAWERTFHRIVE